MVMYASDRAAAPVKYSQPARGAETPPRRSSGMCARADGVPSQLAWCPTPAHAVLRVVIRRVLVELSDVGRRADATGKLDRAALVRDFVVRRTSTRRLCERTVSACALARVGVGGVLACAHMRVCACLHTFLRWQYTRARVRRACAHARKRTRTISAHAHTTPRSVVETHQPIRGTQAIADIYHPSSVSFPGRGTATRECASTNARCTPPCVSLLLLFPPVCDQFRGTARHAHPSEKVGHSAPLCSASNCLGRTPRPPAEV
jgi:hypothetical protein